MYQWHLSKLLKFTMDFGLSNPITEVLVIALYGGNKYYKHI